MREYGADVGYRCFDVSITDKVAHLVLNRPDELNSMVPEFWRELPEIVDGISDEASARVIVISSTGKHFCAGMDLSVFTGGSGAAGGNAKTEAGRRHANLRAGALRLQDALGSLERARMPVIAAIQGGCVGGALDMVAACDMRYCTEDAFFVIQEINIGMTADVGSLQRLPKIMPDGVVRELAYTGRRMPAARAREVGLVNEVYASSEQMLDSVLETAREIAAKSPLAIYGSKVSLLHARDHTVAEGLDFIATWQAGMFQPADMMESFAAKSEQRAPAFDDLLPASKGL